MPAARSFGVIAEPDVWCDVPHAGEPSRRNSTISTDVEAVLAIALAKKSQRRFDSAGELARAFRAAITDQPDPATRARAEAVLAEQPWGSWINDRDR